MKVGTKYEYPDWRLSPTLVDNLKKMYGKFGLNKIEDKNMLAIFLGHTGPSGGFLSKMGALRTYGLITGRGYIQVSDLGKRIAHPEKLGDPYEAVKEAITQIPFWRVLYEKYTSKGVELPDTDFWVDLQEIADLVPDEAKKTSKHVRKDYLDDVQYLKSLEGTQKRGIGMTEQDQLDKNNATPIAVVSDEPAELVKGLVKQGAYDIAKSFIDFLASKDKGTKKEPKTKGKGETEN
jgi:hypothetical protein